MRISDWSSDVCSSDPPYLWNLGPAGLFEPWICEWQVRQPRPIRRSSGDMALPSICSLNMSFGWRLCEWHCWHSIGTGATSSACWLEPCGVWQLRRSEEHTSELQSLMRISYAVFCLKKKKNYR